MCIGIQLLTIWCKWCIQGSCNSTLFAYLGFDAMTTAAEEVKNPQRDLPIGVIASLAICTVLYIMVSGILTGTVLTSLLIIMQLQLHLHYSSCS